MILGLQDSLRAIEQKMTSYFTKIEQRLDSLEQRMITQSELVSELVSKTSMNLSWAILFKNLEDIFRGRTKTSELYVSVNQVNQCLQVF